MDTLEKTQLELWKLDSFFSKYSMDTLEKTQLELWKLEVQERALLKWAAKQNPESTEALAQELWKLQMKQSFLRKQIEKFRINNDSL